MKICQINCVYGVGSTGRIVLDLHCALQKEGCESVVIAPLANGHTKEDGAYTVSNRFLDRLSAIFRRLSGHQYDGAFIQANRILRILKKEKPDVVHLHCINGNNINIYRLLRFLAKNKIKTVYTLHAEFPYTGGCGHAYDCRGWQTGCGHCPIRKEATQSVFFDRTKRTYRKLKKIYALFDKDLLCFTAVSPWLLSRAASSPLIGEFPIYTVLNGVDTAIFHPIDGEEIRKKISLAEDEKMLFHATASFNPYADTLKGGKYILSLCEKLKEEKVRIVVAANYGNIEDPPENLSFVGRVASAEELAKYYAAADLTVVVSKRETFSMPTAESLSVGTPVVGFVAGGPESIANPAYSEFVEYGNTEALCEAVRKWLPFKREKGVNAEENIALYSKETMLGNYMKVYQQFF